MKPQINLVLLFVAIIFGCEKKNSEILEEKEFTYEGFIFYGGNPASDG